MKPRWNEVIIILFCTKTLCIIFSQSFDAFQVPPKNIELKENLSLPLREYLFSRCLSKTWNIQRTFVINDKWKIEPQSVTSHLNNRAISALNSENEALPHLKVAVDNWKRWKSFSFQMGKKYRLWIDILNGWENWGKHHSPGQWNEARSWGE